jgi:hypothetical protein
MLSICLVGAQGHSSQKLGQDAMLVLLQVSTIQRSIWAMMAYDEDNGIN